MISLVHWAPTQQTHPQQGVQPPPNTYIWPVNGTIIDPFRPPKSRYGPGNRGLEFSTHHGSTFWAAGDGIVTFAGQVGGRLHVTVSHADGLRTSYSGVLTIATQSGVRKGARVRAGEVLGTTYKTLHVGIRRGDIYLDPELIFPPRSPPSSDADTFNTTDSSRDAARRSRLIPTRRPPVRLVLLV